jgi:putative iron-regulated protein
LIIIFNNVRSMRFSKNTIAPFLALALGCGDSNENGGSALLEDAAANYVDIVAANYADTLSAAEALATSLDVFVASPSQTTLDAAKNAWLEAREPYLQTEVFRFYDGPIDNPDNGPEGFLNAWPLDEAYIDYVTGAETSGLVNSTESIDGPTLRGANEAGGETNIATGYHAIEFLLWGQDLSEDGPGNRPFTDFVTDGTGTATNQDRRGQYLSTVTDLLLEDLGGLEAAWEDGASYPAEFVAAGPEESLRRILTGMIILSGFETGGERLQTALDTADQEDEHSCFSDNTHRDMIQDVVGIQNVWLGSYERLDGSKVEGVGIRDVVDAEDSELAAKLDAQIATSLSLANALQPPFDIEISSGNDAGRERVRALVISLQVQEGLLQDVFRLFALEIPVAE